MATHAGSGGAAAAAQVAVGAPDTTSLEADSSDLFGQARTAQARFERRRLYHLPVTLESFGGVCDEHVGRFCSWYDEGDWYPVPERDEIGRLRSELLAVLDSTQRHLPGDGWVLGQRVWYLGEAGRWGDAIDAARACGDVEPWWCAALAGFALHGAGQYLASSDAFDRALAAMPSDQATRWSVPRRAVDSDGRGLLDGLRDAPPDSTSRMLERLWMLADPLYLVPGNDRRTAHLSRWVVSTLRERARNPFHIAWGRDLEELTVRHGWEIGWERAPSRGITTFDHVIGHKHPQGRDFMPDGRALRDPAAAPPQALEANRTRPRSLYAPEYAPVLLPMDAQVAVFPRGERMLVVATSSLPVDTTYHAGHTHEVPWLAAGDQAGMPDRAGLFFVPVEGGRPGSATTSGRTDAVLMLEARTGPGVVSVETWSPERRRAGRYRAGVDRAPVPEDIPVLSDLLLLHPLPAQPTTLEEVLPRALPHPRIVEGGRVAVAWEVSGLGFRPETLAFELEFTRTNRSLVRRVGEFLGLAGDDGLPRLSWSEPGPERPGPHFGYVTLDLPSLGAGDFLVSLTLRTANRTDVLTSRVLRIDEIR